MKDLRLPALLIVHGAWDHHAMWDELAAELPGVDIRTVALTSVGDPSIATLGDLHDDAAVIRAAADAINGPVVVAAHSYGGAPTTEALVGSENIERLVYLNAFMPAAGESVAGLMADPSIWGSGHRTVGYVEMLNTEITFYSDRTPNPLAGSQSGALGTRLGTQSLASLTQPVRGAAWRTVPSTYVIGAYDYSVPMSELEFFSGRAERVVRLQTSASLFCSRPRETAAMLREELAIAATHRPELAPARR